MTAPGLSLRDVRKTYPGFELGPMSLELTPGTAMGLLGPNGAGKTTLLNVIALQSRLTSGAMRYGGASIAWGDARWKSRISYIREAPAFYDELTIGETLRFAERIYDEWDGPFADALVARFGLDRSRKLGTLSKGTRVKVGLVAGLAHRAQFLLLDEPTAGLDPDAREDLQRTLRDLLRERPDVSILLSSHIFEDLDTVADRVAIIRKGRLVFDCAREELAALALYRLPAGLDPGGLSDARLSWQSDGHRSVLVERASPLGAALARLPGAVEQPSEAMLAAVYRGTQHA
jgi:ABC-2 type transport system ATP-binding protein